MRLIIKLYVILNKKEIFIMNTIKDTITNEIIINKSRFITTIFHINSVNEANNYLSEIRKKYYDATHNCYAYIIGENEEIQKFSDDGEPSQTAGAPMMDILKKNNMTNVLVVVTRYFGGILLGIGGLVRAYSDSIIQIIEKSEKYRITKLQKLLLSLNYTEYNLLIDSISKTDIIKERFSEKVDLQIGVSINYLPYFKQEFENVTRGKGILICDKEYLGLEKI